MENSSNKEVDIDAEAVAVAASCDDQLDPNQLPTNQEKEVVRIYDCKQYGDCTEFLTRLVTAKYGLELEELIESLPSTNGKDGKSCSYNSVISYLRN